MSNIYLLSKTDKIQDIIYQASIGKHINNINCQDKKRSFKGKKNYKINLNTKDKKNYFKVNYLIDDKSEISVLGEEFVNINKNKCKIILNNKRFKLITKINAKYLKNKYNFNNLYIKIKIEIIDVLLTLSYMFNECNSLLSLDNSFNNIGLSKFNLNKIKNMSSMFEGCSSLISLPDISKWNMTNVNDINGLFSECSSLISLPDISKWNMINVNDISCLFYGCLSLISLPDISKWNIII